MINATLKCPHTSLICHAVCNRVKHDDDPSLPLLIEEVVVDNDDDDASTLLS
jgi:hypothetical protein